MGKLTGKVAIITGAGAGIGEATAQLFVQEGIKVGCCALSDSAVNLAQTLKKKGADAVGFKCDVSKEDDIKKFVLNCYDVFQHIDIVVNNAGIVIPGRVEHTSSEDWDKTMAVNVKSIYLMSKYTLPYLKQSRGTIINVSSAVALKGVKDRAAYSASKGAVFALTKAMAADCIEDHIRVNCVSPGTTETPSLEKRIQKFENPTEARKQFISRQPMKKFGTPEEIAQAILFLASNQFCTGTNIVVDGGMTL